MSFDEKKFKHELLEMFSEELQESERDMRNAIDGLRRSLTSDFRNPSELKRNSKHRLDFLRVATMKEEQSYNRLKVSPDDYPTSRPRIALLIHYFPFFYVIFGNTIRLFLR